MRELDELRKMEKTDADHHRANDARAALRRKLNVAEDAAAAAAHPQPREKKVSARPVRVGDTVQLRKMGDIKATVTAISADRTLTLRAGIMNVTAKEQDVYLLENEKFRLYYTAEGDEAHNFIVVVEDNFKNSYELEFDFNNRNVKDDIQTVIPIGNYKPLPR